MSELGGVSIVDKERSSNISYKKSNDLIESCH